jgi:hypothetical protein
MFLLSDFSKLDEEKCRILHNELYSIFNMILVQERELEHKHPPPPLHVVSVTRVNPVCVASEEVEPLPATALTKAGGRGEVTASLIASRHQLHHLHLHLPIYG